MRDEIEVGRCPLCGGYRQQSTASQIVREIFERVYAERAAEGRFDDSAVRGLLRDAPPPPSCAECTHTAPRVPASVAGHVKHVRCDGARFHVLRWGGGGVRCSEPDCVLNQDA